MTIPVPLIPYAVMPKLVQLKGAWGSTKYWKKYLWLETSVLVTYTIDEIQM